MFDFDAKAREIIVARGHAPSRYEGFQHDFATALTEAYRQGVAVAATICDLLESEYDSDGNHDEASACAVCRDRCRALLREGGDDADQG